MATGNQKTQNGATDNLRKHLALAVRSIQWSYAIFWSFSAKQSGSLEWSDGFYNGDIKTRKTVQAAELNSDPLGLQRSDQLRELFESLSLGETSPQPKRPTAALSPEDLTDTEWYFLVCMSFVFKIGQGLPGRSFAKNEPIWLCDAHLSNTKVFSRSLLAKSASLQTVVCFPHLGGVVEIGTTEQVPEDRSLIQHIITSFLESSDDIVINPKHDCVLYQVPYHASIPEANLDDVEVRSPDTSSDDFADNVLIEGSGLADGVDGDASQLQSWHFKEDAVSNVRNNSSSSSDCVSQTHGNLETPVSLFNEKKMSDGCMPVNQECNQKNSPGFNGVDVHYQSVLSCLLKTSHQLILGPYRNGNRKSSFISWKDRNLNHQLPQSSFPQSLLKKVLFEVAKMHENARVESVKQKDKCDDNSGQEANEVDRNHVLSERKRREKISERFSILGSIVPSGGKVDKVSILDHTIEYLRELERKVKELESYKEATERESITRIKTHESIERTSDNYGQSKFGSTTKLLGNKREACDVEKVAAEKKRARTSSSTDSITISITDKDVLIEMRCPWRQFVLLEVMEALNQLNLDSQSVQSSNTDGFLSMSINAKSKGVKGASASAVKQALQRIIRKC